MEKMPAEPLPANGTLLIDASSYLFRAWFGVPDVFTDRRGRPLNAVVGFARSLALMLRTAKPARVAVAFDEALFSGFRHRIDPDYKAGRVLPDRDLAFQMTACRRLVESLGMAAVASREYEADDLLASMAVRDARRGHAVIVASEDKDLAQVLAHDQTRLWQLARERVLDAGQAEAWLGVHPVRLPELQALTGDAIDGIAGIPGVGRKTAVALVSACAHIDVLLKKPEQVRGLPIRGAAGLAERLAEHRERVRTNLRLTTLATRATGLPALRALDWKAPGQESVRAAIQSLGLPAGSARHFEGL